MSTRGHISVKLKKEDIGKIMCFEPLLVPEGNKHLFGKKYGVVKLDKPYITIYHHFDSYPKGLGKELIENYSTYEKALNLCLGGDCSSILDGSVCQYYGSYDEDWDFVCPKLSDEEPKCDEDYLYLYDGDEWYLKSRRENNLKKLSEIIL